MERDTKFLAYNIAFKRPIVYVKYGDGEYNCCIDTVGYNINRDTYTNKLKNGLINSLKYYVDETDNSYIGRWHDNNVINYYQSLVKKRINFLCYESIINYFWQETITETKEKVNLLKTIKQSNLKKIIICNNLLVKSKILLNIDDLIEVPYNNWFDEYYDTILDQTTKSIEYNPSNEQCIVLTACGMGAKVLIADLHKRFPKNIYLDLGSAIDEICTKLNTRHNKNHYDEYIDIYKEIIPWNWNDPSYDYIYNESLVKLAHNLSADSNISEELIKHALANNSDFQNIVQQALVQDKKILFLIKDNYLLLLLV